MPHVGQAAGDCWFPPPPPPKRPPRLPNPRPLDQPLSSSCLSSAVFPFLMRSNAEESFVAASIWPFVKAPIARFTYKPYCNAPFDYQFVDELFAQTFKTQQQFGSILTGMASLAILIASLGLLGMKERARLIGGEVHITGKENGGTTVVVRVPLDV